MGRELAQEVEVDLAEKRDVKQCKDINGVLSYRISLACWY